VGTALTVLAKHGFDATSMEQIAEATGIPSEEIVATIGTKDAVVTCSTNRVDSTPKSTSRRHSSCVTGSIGLIGY
jgi:hypothetical protein